jgi:hypothetical protein
VIDARLRALEPFSPSWESAISELQAFGLKRLDDALRPVYERVVAISQVGVMFSAASASELTVGMGTLTLVLAEEDRARFAAAAYIGVMKNGDSSVQMSGQLVSYARDTGVLIIDADHAAGSGNYADWRVSASVDGTIFQAVIDGLAAEVDAALAVISDASNMTSGTLPAARLPAPTGTSLGGVVSASAPAKKFAVGIDGAGALVFQQPSFSDVSGKATADQLPAPSATALGGVKSAAASVGQVMTGIDTMGAPVFGSAAVGFRNRLRNTSFAINQRSVSGTVTLAAGAYGHDGVKAGASGATYTFAASGIDVVLTVTAGSIILPIEGIMIEGGTYYLSQAGTAQARVWQGTGNTGSGSYAAPGFTVTGLTAGAQTNVEFSTGTVLRPQFEPDDRPTRFERRPPGVEMLLCQRYYTTTYDGAAIGTVSAEWTAIQQIMHAASNYATVYVFFPVRMKAQPSIFVYSPKTGAVNKAWTQNGAVDINGGIWGASPRGFIAFASPNSGPIAASDIVMWHYVAISEL